MKEEIWANFAFSGVDEPEWSGTAFRYLLFSRNTRSGGPLVKRGRMLST